MRIAILLAATGAFCSGGDSDFTAALLGAKSVEERAVLMRGHDARELAAARDGIEKKAGASYDAKDYPAALNAF
jgi:hypothetical protein